MPTVIGKDASVTKRATCRQCGAINEYLPNEVRILYQGKDIDGGTSVSKGFNCGSCHKEIITDAY